MGPGIVTLQSFLRVSRQIRHEMQEVLQKRMGRQLVFKARCRNLKEVMATSDWAETAFRGNIPSARRVQVSYRRRVQGTTRRVLPQYTHFTSWVTWRKSDFENE
jgi:hypothetical protein